MEWAGRFGEPEGQGLVHLVCLCHPEPSGSCLGQEIEVGTERFLQTSTRAAPAGPRLLTFYQRASQVRTQLVLRTPLPWFGAPADGCRLKGFPVWKALTWLISVNPSCQATALSLLQKPRTGLFWASVVFLGFTRII